MMINLHEIFTRC